MLREVAPGVLIHESEFVQSNAIVVIGQAGVLLIDPGVHGDEMVCLANDLSTAGQCVVAGFSTHPHWDHLLWHASFGDVPRYGTSRCALAARHALSEGIDRREDGIPDEVPLELLGIIAGLPDETTHIPWEGPRVRILQHRAHAPGHAALLIEELRVLVAGDMLSDVLIPLLDFDNTARPVEDYLAALDLLESVSGDVDVLIPGHGSIGTRVHVQARVDQDRAYVHTLRDGAVPNDARFSTEYAKNWLPGVHAHQLDRLAQRSDRRATPG